MAKEVQVFFIAVEVEFKIPGSQGWMWTLTNKTIDIEGRMVKIRTDAMQDINRWSRAFERSSSRHHYCESCAILRNRAQSGSFKAIRERKGWTQVTDWTLPIIRNLSIILLRRLFITADFELGLNLKVVSMTSSFTYMAYARIIRKKKKI